MAVFLAGYWFSVSDGHIHNDALASENFIPPNISLQRLEGGKVDLKSYRGKWVLLNFWATWCPPCVEEMPSLENFYKKNKKNNMTVLAISLDKGDAKTVKAFVKKHGLTFEVFHDPQSIASRPFHVSGLPSTFVLNPKGEVVAQAVGGRNWEDPVVVDYFVKLMSSK